MLTTLFIFGESLCVAVLVTIAVHDWRRARRGRGR